MLGQPDPDYDRSFGHGADNKLQTALPRALLERRLRETFRQADLSIRETGVNILYLALGMLKWYESDSSDTERRAPLILIPVELYKSNVRTMFKLRWNQEGVEANLSLEAKLKQDFGVSLPAMPREEDLDVDEYLLKVEKAVAPMRRWVVAQDAVHLNFFNFRKLLIYRDLDPEGWPEGKRPADHPVVKKIFCDGSLGAETPGSADPDENDGGENLEDLYSVADSDSSQTDSILDALRGHNLVIQGPPGTGKSQTITNLIGEALARGKKVLFVAEKMAALEVVKRRLDAAHLGDACLELHSHNANKKAVLDELHRTLRQDQPIVESQNEAGALLGERRERLDEYARAVNTPVAASGLTPHELVGRMSKLKADGLDIAGPQLPIKGSEAWDREQFVVRRDKVRELQTLVNEIGTPSQHVWWLCGRLLFIPTDEHSVRQVLEAASHALQGLRENAEILIGWLAHDSTFDGLRRVDVARTIGAARRALEAPELRGADHRAPEWVVEAARIAELTEAARSFSDLRSRHAAVLIPEAWDADVLAVRQALGAYRDKWWRFLSGRYRAARRAVAGLCRGKVPGTVLKQIALVDAILKAHRLRQEIGRSRGLIGRLFPGMTLRDRVEEHRVFAEAASWLMGLHRDVSAGLVGDEVHDFLSLMGDVPDLSAATDACESSAAGLAEALHAVANTIELRTERLESGESLADQAYGSLGTWLRATLDQIPSMQDVVRFNQLKKSLAELHIPDVADEAASRPDAAEHLTALFEHACYASWLDSAFSDRDALATFHRATHEEVIEAFVAADRAQFDHNRALIARRHWDQLPRHRGGGQLGILRHEFQKRARHLPVRELIQKAGHAVQQIKPVFMMSPLSIAKYIPPGSVDFDLAIFDEASQVRPVDALGAIIRAKQTVVVGDSQQLPPTKFFDRMVESEVEEGSQPISDLESILGVFCSRGARERMLRWHYRSRHESLITVSNHEFYDNRLMVFPSPDAAKEEVGLAFRHDPDAFYEGHGINSAEAKKVAHAVMKHAREQPELTLGVAAFSVAQARRIDDELYILRRRDPSCEEFFSAHPHEPFFVKNLENVQGDERDVILISIGYGRTAQGRLPMRFGPLNQEGGERRLNVLITRARRRCIVHCNFVGADLDLRRTRSRGVRVLKTFLEYAQHGVLDVPEASGRDADSPFEEAVASALRGAGHDVVHQVGSAGFYVDLAVVDPERPGRYLLGVECDGATYHSSRSARDRDRIRQEVLEGLGWRIHRIWSTDWFRNPRRELERVDEAIRAAKVNAASTPPPKPEPRKPPARTPVSVPEVLSPTASYRAAHASSVPTPTPEPGKPLERLPASVPEVLAPTAFYRTAHVDQDSLEMLQGESPGDPMAALIARVVEVESPIHVDEVALRIRPVLGVARAGSRIRKKVRDAAKKGTSRNLFRIDKSWFLWRLDHRVVEVRRRDGSGHSPRDPVRIAFEEIEAALLHAVRVSFGIKPADAIKEAARLFGFKRAGRAIVERFRHVLDELVAAGKLRHDRYMLRVPHEP